MRTVHLPFKFLHILKFENMYDKSNITNVLKYITFINSCPFNVTIPNEF